MQNSTPNASRMNSDAGTAKVSPRREVQRVECPDEVTEVLTRATFEHRSRTVRRDEDINRRERRDDRRDRDEDRPRNERDRDERSED
tara:strand:- start:103 stop:363 length:261 start_codon:yes stop_codon:yes gene_type:complete